MDAGGGMTRLDLYRSGVLHVYYVQLEEDVDRYPGSPKIGEDYLTGSTLMLKPITGLDLHLFGVYSMARPPSAPRLTGSGGPFNNVASDSLNVTTESRYYLGFDSRYRIGNTSIEPTFIYLLGTRKFHRIQLRPSPASRTPTTMPFRRVSRPYHTMGPWLFGAKSGYISGDDANDDINNTRFGNRSDVNGFRILGNGRLALLRLVVRDSRQVGRRLVTRSRPFAAWERWPSWTALAG